MSYLKKTSFLFAFLVMVILCYGESSGQVNTPLFFNGYKPITNYSPGNYNLLPQNLCIAQDQRGIIYIANQGGVLEFDSITFRTIGMPGTIASSLCIGSNGTVFVGGNNEVGYLEPDETGLLQFVSLTPYLDEKDRDFSFVYQTLCTSSGVWFRTVKKLFRWHDHHFTVWDSLEKNSSFKAIFTWKKNLYVQQQGIGLLKFDGEKFTGTKQSFDDFFGEGGQKIYLSVPYDQKRMLMATRQQGLFLFDGKKIQPFRTDADQYLETHSIYHGIRLRNGQFALATLSGGVVFIDAAGRLESVYTAFSGLQDDNVKFLMEDHEGHVWLAMNQGISRIDYSSPISHFDQRNNLKGLILSIAHRNNHLYVGTSNGLFAMTASETGQISMFKTIPGFPGNCWHMLDTGDTLLAATRQGIFQVNHVARPIYTPIPTYALCKSSRFAGSVWAGTDRQLLALRKKKTKWEVYHRFPQIQNVSIRFMVESKDGRLWLCTQSGGVIRLDFPTDIRNPVISTFSRKDGLPTGGIRVFNIGNRTIFAANNGIYSFNDETQRFEPDHLLGKFFAGGGNDVFRLNRDNRGDLWIHSSRSNYRAIIQEDNSYKVDDTPFRVLPKAQANAIYSWGSTVWIGDTNGLIRFNRESDKNYNQPFQTLIRSVSIGKDTIVYGGSGQYGSDKENMPELSIDYRDRHIQFQVAALFFKGSEKNTYKYYMQGYDNTWSKWSTASIKDYPNMTHGSYTFKVQSRNVYGALGKETEFSFRVLPPWYLTWWAFLIYISAAVLLVMQIVRWRSKKLIREKLLLEQVVEKRTHQINQANMQLQMKTRQLEEQSEKLKELDKIKSRFFANISHEFRTPLTLILGPLDRIRRESIRQHPELEKEIDMVSRNAHRLMALIDQLLDLSKFESGKMKLSARQMDFVSFLKGMMEPFSTLAGQLKLALTFKSIHASLPLYIDAEKLEKVIANLISNALKFTPAKGEIKIQLSLTNTAGETLESPPTSGGWALVRVKDNGKGIPPEQLEHIFDRFYQAEVTVEHHRKGSGIGLALVKELMALHHGTIEVESHVGTDSGTCFTLRLPLGNDHLSEEEQRKRGEPSEDREQDFTPANAFDHGFEITNDGLLQEPIEPETLFQAANGSNGNGKPIILVVEDNADLRQYIRSSLEDSYTIFEARDGKEGIEKAKTIVPDLIISDIMMPEADGNQLCRTVKGDIATSHIPVVLLTARVSEESIVEGLEGGADDYITKPFNTRVLTVRIRNLIQLRRQLQLKLNRQMVLQPTRIDMSDMDREFLKDLQEVIEKNISDPEFNVEDLSKRLYMSRTTVYRKIQALSGETPTDFIRSYRLMRAAQLLSNRFGSVTEVAFEVGFSSRAYFTKCFKEKFHQLPSEFVTSQMPKPS